MFCRICQSNRMIIGYKRDDPILDCGHIHQLLDSETKARIVYQEYHQRLSGLQAQGLTLEEAQDLIINENFDEKSHQELVSLVSTVVNPSLPILDVPDFNPL